MAILRCMVTVSLPVLITLMVTTAETIDNCQCDAEHLIVRCASLFKTEFRRDDSSCGPQFTDLDLSKNLLHDYPQDVREYKFVNMSSNSLLRLESQEVQEVEKLDLSMNLIQRIDLGNSFPKLLILNISDNLLGNEYEDFLSGHCDLMYLDVSGNMISTLYSITRCRKLKFLLASRNSITTLPSALLAFKELELLDVSSNGLAQISNLPKSLELLNLKQNNISVLDTESFANLELLRYLMLESNKIKEIESDAFSSLSSLEVLDITGNKLQKLSTDLFRGLKVLKALVLTDNDIESIAKDSFSDLSELRHLVLDGNALTNIPSLRLGKSVQRVSLLLNLIEEVDAPALMALFSGSESIRFVVLALNDFRGDDPGWKDVLDVFEWRCADQNFTLLVNKAYEMRPSLPRYQSHQKASSDCGCAIFTKDNWNVGVCVSDVETIDGHWLRETHASAAREDSDPRDEL